MLNEKVLGKTIQEWKTEFPIIKDLTALEETLWINPDKEPYEDAVKNSVITIDDIKEASARLDRFANYFKKAFPETISTNGLLESPFQDIPKMQKLLEDSEGTIIKGKMLIKLDSHLPISGSIKARGGIYEVLKLAEDIAIKENYITTNDDYSLFDSDKFRQLFSKYSVAVGSTGNLGLSIGIISAKLGFKVDVHMSADARQWKKDMLRSKGVRVHEYQFDYSIAVAEGRKIAEQDPFCHFVDDENSQTLFLGYAVAGLRLKKQFEEKNIVIDKEHPLFVYLPCGVGGGPGGVAFGLNIAFGENVHCFFAEPTNSCCMTLGLATGYNDKISVQDFGIDNKTVADGLAVGRASGFVGKVMKPFIDGSYTVKDNKMYKMLAELVDTENLKLEPSALAGMVGPVYLNKYNHGVEYIKANEFNMENSYHLVWATGGNMVPKEDMDKYYKTGKNI